MNKLSLKTSLLSAVFFLHMITALAQTLRVGMQAPPLKVGGWVKGGAIKSFKPGQIYVVEFWGTWCKPCMTVIPMLTAYAKKYKGKVNVIGVSIHEENSSTVAPFVKKMGDKMNYHVAIDCQKSPTAKEGYMSKNWVAAAKAGGLPLTFVVGKTGKIDYIGGADLRSVLPQMIEGTWAVISDEEWLRSALGAKRAKIRELIQRSETFEEAVKELDEYAQMPGSGRDLYPKAWALAQKALVYMWIGKSQDYFQTVRDLYEFYQTVPASYLGWESGDRTMVLNNVIVWPIVDPEKMPYIKITRSDNDYKFALTVANHMVKFNPDDLNAMDSQAWAYYHMNDYENARTIFDKVQAIAPNDGRLKASYDLFKSKVK